MRGSVANFCWFHQTSKTYISHLMTKPTKWHVRPAKTQISLGIPPQSDLSLCCPHEETLGPKLPIQRRAKTLIRLGGCPGWSESSLGAQWFCWFCHEVAHILDPLPFICPPFLHYKITKIFHGCLVWTEKCILRVIVWHHEAKKDAEQWSRGTDFSIRPGHPWWILFLAYHSISKLWF